MEIDPHSAQQKTAALLKQIWQKNRPLLTERLTLLQDTQELLAAGPLTEEQRSEAASVAHKLAGTLGMFGLPEATDAARELEVLLDTHHPNVESFNKSLRKLKAVVETKDHSA